MLGQMIGLGLGLIVLTLALNFLGGISRIAFEIHEQIISMVHLEKSTRWIAKLVHTSGFDFCGIPEIPEIQEISENTLGINFQNPVQIISDPNIIKSLGLMAPGRVKYVSGNILEIQSALPVSVIQNQNKKQKKIPEKNFEINPNSGIEPGDVLILQNCSQVKLATVQKVKSTSGKQDLLSLTSPIFFTGEISGVQIGVYRQKFLYHCQAGLCLKNQMDLKQNNRQVLVSGLTDFAVSQSKNNQESQIDFYLAEGKTHLSGSI